MKQGKRKRTMSLFAALFSFLFIASVGVADESAVKSSRDGTVQIPWSPEYSGFDSLQVRQSTTGTEFVYPVIEQQGWSLSGLSDGQYNVQLVGNSAQQHLFTLSVEHYPLQAALTLFGLGALLFGYLLFTLWRGERRS